MRPIYHITTHDRLAELAAGRLEPTPGTESPHDPDGPRAGHPQVTHCAYAEQLVTVTNELFAARNDLVLLELDAARVTHPISEEPAPNSTNRYPHVHGPIPLAAVLRVIEFPPRPDGRFDPPAGLLAAVRGTGRTPESRGAAGATPAASIDALLAAYDWYDHPEGPKFVETHRDAHRTCGHWLFLPGAISAFHQVLNNEELWLIHAGRLWLHVIEADGSHRLHRLGGNVARGERPVVAVGRALWQAAELPPGEPFAFGSNLCAPPFEFGRFRLAERAALIAQFPQHRGLITRLTYDT